MNTHADQTQENKSQSVANDFSQKQKGSESTFQFADNRPEAITQKILQEMANNYSTQQQQPIQKKENKKELPYNLKDGIENLSGHSMDDVKVHFNSDKPAQLEAHAYAQETDIHVASGQEKRLPQEAFYVVQQKQGRVKPIMQKMGENITDDCSLQKEADEMGTMAAKPHSSQQHKIPDQPAAEMKASKGANEHHHSAVVQRLVADGYNKLYAPAAWLNTTFDDRTETIREALNDLDKVALKVELLQNISNTAGVYVFNIEEENNPSGMLTKLMTDASRLNWPTGHKERQLKAVIKPELQAALPNLNMVMHPPTDNRLITMYEFHNKKVISPNHLVKADSDLAATSPGGGGYSITKVCALIAIYKSEGKENMNQLLGLKNNLGGGDAAYYEALHDYFYGKNNIEYDEPVTHPGIYSRFGYKIIHSGRTTFTKLHTVLSKSLEAGKKYIIDLDNHSVYVTMKKTFVAGVGKGDGKYSDFFDFHSDPNNFNTGELNQDIEYIYEK